MGAKRDVEGMGPPEIKYGESLCFVQHAATGLWLTYAAADTKAMRLGLLKRRVCVGGGPWGGCGESLWGYGGGYGGIWGAVDEVIGGLGGLWGVIGGGLGEFRGLGA